MKLEGAGESAGFKGWPLLCLSQLGCLHTTSAVREKKDQVEPWAKWSVLVLDLVPSRASAFVYSQQTHPVGVSHPRRCARAALHSLCRVLAVTSNPLGAEPSLTLAGVISGR